MPPRRTPRSMIRGPARKTQFSERTLKCPSLLPRRRKVTVARVLRGEGEDGGFVQFDDMSYARQVVALMLIRSKVRMKIEVKTSVNMS